MLAVALVAYFGWVSSLRERQTHEECTFIAIDVFMQWCFSRPQLTTSDDLSINFVTIWILEKVIGTSIINIDCQVC